MLIYNRNNKVNSRQLRTNQTPAEILLWSKIRRRQIKNIQFYRQKPIGNFIVDFYAPAVNLVIEVDGGQHYEENYLKQDRMRDAYLRELNLTVLRFSNLEVMQSIESVIQLIFTEISARI